MVLVQTRDHTRKRASSTVLYSMISLVAGALAYAGPAHRCAPPLPRRAVLRDHAQIVAALGRQAPEQLAQREALARLLAGAGLPEDGAITELSAGFCNWVYRVDYPAPTGSVVAKLFSPLARLRLSPAMRGMGDARAAAEGLGPRLHFLLTEGLVVDFVQGAELTEGDIHASLCRRRRVARKMMPVPFASARRVWGCSD